LWRKDKKMKRKKIKKGYKFQSIVNYEKVTKEKEIDRRGRRQERIGKWEGRKSSFIFVST